MALTSLTNDFTVRSGIVVQGTTVVTSSTGQVGAAQINGGTAISKNLIVGTTADVWGNTNLKANLNVTGTTVLSGALLAVGQANFNSDVITTGTFYLYGNATLEQNLTVKQDGSIEGKLTVTQLTNLLGGLTVTNATYLGGSLDVVGISKFDNTVFVTGTNSLIVGSGPTTLGGTLDVAGNVTITTNTVATVGGGGAGALDVTGGAYIGNNLIVYSSAWDTGTNTSNALYIRGGAWIDESLVVAGPTTFNGIVTFNGTATYVLSTNTVYTDNLLNLHTPPGGIDSEWNYDDGKDIGLIFHYYKGEDKNGFLGFANDTGYLEWYNDGIESNGIFTGTSYGTFKTSDIVLVGTTNSSNTVSGALQVAGGFGLGLDLYAGGSVSGNTLTARNLTQNRIVIAGASGQLSDNANLTWNASLNQIEGRVAFANTATTANTATNLAGGTTGSIPYQTATGVTVLLPIGSPNYALISDGSAPYWGPISGISAGSANTATNIAGGQTDQIPYQSAPGATTFSNNLTFNGTTLTASNIVVSGTTDATSTTSGALQVVGGVGIGQSLFVGNSATIKGDLYVDGDIFLRGTELNTISAQTGTFQNVIVDGVTGTGLLVIGDQVINRNLKVLGITTISNAVITTASITNLTVTESTTTNLTVTGNTNLQNVTATDLTATNLTVTNIADLNYLTAEVSTLTSLTVTSDATIDGNLNVSGTSTFTNNLIVNDTTNAISTITGSIITQGGVGVGKDLHVGGSITVSGTTSNVVVPAFYSNNVIVSSFTSNAITSTSTQNLDVFSAATYRTARYTVQIVSGLNVHVTEMSLFHDGSNVYINEYGISTNNGPLGEFDAVLSGGNVTLKFTPNSTSSTVIKILRFGITV